MDKREIHDTRNHHEKRDGDSPSEEKAHPVDKSNWLSFGTFSWMSPLMYSSHRERGLQTSQIPKISILERCGGNTESLEQIWTRERALSEKPDFGRVLWMYSRRRVFLTTIVYVTSLLLGFIGPTILMKKVLGFAANTEAEKRDGILWISLLVLCEISRVFFFTLTWAMSYRTALRLKTASTGLVYRKIFRLRNMDDAVASKLMNVISGDCSRLYEVVISSQVAIGGPIVLILSVGYILYELGWLSLIGISVFPLAYPVQYLLAKGSGSLKRKAVSVKDARVSLMTQAIQNLKFIKMFGWEKHFYRRVSDEREKELNYLRKSQILQSWSVVLGPTLPHIGAIITFILYINSGNDLTPAQAFCVTALFIGRIRPTLSRMRTGFRAYFDSKIAIERVQCFTILFVFSLLGYSVRAVNQLAELFYSNRIIKERMEAILTLEEIGDGNKENYGSNSSALSEAIVINEVNVIRRNPPETGIRSKSKKQTKNAKEFKSNGKEEVLNSLDELLGASENTSDENSIPFQLDIPKLTVNKGSFIGICGLVGSGKSTLIDTVAGAIMPDKGRINVMGKVAYVSQQPWIFKGTLRENIIFGEPFDSVRYYNAIDCCCLVNDFGMMPLGDLTETNEKGDNLSGGQKQRISLARALYSHSRDIYLLDDCFSGLDTRVAKTIFERVVRGRLKDRNKTVLLVTHQLQFLRECEEIFVLDEGKILERGNHDQLLNQSQSYYSSLISTLNNNHPDADENTQDVWLEDSMILDCKPDITSVSKNKKEGDLLNSEGTNGSIPCDVYNLYIKAAGGVSTLLLVLLAFALCIGSTAVSSWWLKRWFQSPGLPPLSTGQDFARDSGFNSSSSNVLSDEQAMSENVALDEGRDEDVERNSTHILPQVINMYTPNYEFNRDFYAGIIGAIFITSVARTLLFVWTTMKASQGLHRKMLSQFFRSRLKSSYRVGFGQIINLFSRDISEIDSSLPNTLETFLQNIFIVVSVLVLVTIVFPVFLAPLCLLSVLFLWIRNIYISAVRNLKRFENDCKTPIFSKVTESVLGLATIRAYGKQRLLVEGFEALTDTYHSVFYTFISSVRWLSVRLDLMAVGVTGVTALLIVIFHGSVSAAAAGLALAYAAQLSGVFQFTVRLASETEAKFVSMERIYKFLTQVQTEDLQLNLKDKNRPLEGSGSRGKLHLDIGGQQQWPLDGRVKFDAVNLSYSSDHPNALRDLSFEVFGGQKIGIVGRTGSGKSSIGNALFRLHEIKSGTIIIDNVDISTLSLETLRNSLCLVPQDPSIFQQSVRFNLDPGNMHTDDDLWIVLEKVGLRGAVDNLDREVGLSQGQKQLLSISRALLRNSKVLFVDEATSNIDCDTRGIMDRLLAQEFQSSTVFIVAHRLSSLAYCNYILVLEDGQVRDFGPVDVVTAKPEFLCNFERFDTIQL